MAERQPATDAIRESGKGIPGTVKTTGEIGAPAINRILLIRVFHKITIASYSDSHLVISEMKNILPTFLCGLLLTSIPAQADVLYQNFDPNDIAGTVDGGTSWDLNKNQVPTFFFTATDTGSLTSINTVAWSVAGGDTYHFYLYDGTGGGVGPLLASWTTSLPHSGVLCTLDVSASGIQLNKDSGYWLGIGGTDDALGAWDLIKGSNNTPSICMMGEAAVPEPASCALFGGAAVLGLVLVKRRRK